MKFFYFILLLSISTKNISRKLIIKKLNDFLDLKNHKKQEKYRKLESILKQSNVSDKKLLMIRKLVF